MREVIITIVLLLLAIIFFVSFPFIRKSFLKRNVSKYLLIKVKHISERNKFLYLNDINYLYGDNTYKCDQIIFGNKFVYVISFNYFDGIVLAKEVDNSWVYISLGKKEASYIPNLFNKSNEIKESFSSVSKIDKSLLVIINVLSDETDLRLDKKEKDNTVVINEHKLAKTIAKFERKDEKALDKEQIKIVYEEIKGKYSTSK